MEFSGVVIGTNQTFDIEQRGQETISITEDWFKYGSNEVDGEIFSDSEKKKLLDHASVNVCVLDEKGFIIYTNLAWRGFSTDNGGDNSFTGLGINYLEVCKKAVSGDVTSDTMSASAVYEAVSRLISGASSEEFSLEYPCTFPPLQTLPTWWLVRAATFFKDPSTVRTIIAHKDITEEKEADAQPASVSGSSASNAENHSTESEAGEKKKESNGVGSKRGREEEKEGTAVKSAKNEEDQTAAPDANETAES